MIGYILNACWSHLNREIINVLTAWKMATPVIVGWFAGCTQACKSKRYI